MSDFLWVLCFVVWLALLWLQYLEWVTQAVRRSSVLSVAAERSGALLCCVASPISQILGLTALLSRPPQASLFRSIFSSNFFSGPENCLMLRPSPTPYFKSVSICSDLFCVCVRYRVRFNRFVLSLSLCFYLFLSLSLSPSPALSAFCLSLLVSCFVKAIAFVPFDWWPKFSAESVSLQALCWSTATGIAPFEVKSWVFAPRPEKRDRLALLATWCSTPCCLVSASVWLWQSPSLAGGDIHILLITKGGANITPCHSHMTFCSLWEACLSFGMLIEICDWVWHACRQSAGCAVYESNLYLATFSALFALHLFFGAQQPKRGRTNKQTYDAFESVGRCSKHASCQTMMIPSWKHHKLAQKNTIVFMRLDATWHGHIHHLLLTIHYWQGKSGQNAVLKNLSSCPLTFSLVTRAERCLPELRRRRRPVSRPRVNPKPTRSVGTNEEEFLRHCLQEEEEEEECNSSTTAEAWWRSSTRSWWKNVLFWPLPWLVSTLWCRAALHTSANQSALRRKRDQWKCSAASGEYEEPPELNTVGVPTNFRLMMKVTFWGARYK